MRGTEAGQEGLLNFRSSFLSVAVPKHSDQKQLGEKGFIWFAFPARKPMTEGTRIRSHGRALCAGLLSAWLSGSWAARFLSQSKTTCPGMVLPTVEPSHTSHQEKPAPTDMATRQLIKAILQLRFASSQVTLGYALTIKTNQDSFQTSRGQK